MSELSVHDKQLSNAAKHGIKTAKENYNKAKQNNDTVGMAKANEYANNIRKQYGGYTGGDDGSGYYPVPTLNSKDAPQYSSRYDSEIRKARKAITNREPFSYNPETDPMYKLYKKVYTQLGNDAYDRAMAQNSIKTGGIVNTNAAASATQAQSFYNSALADKATELYDSAYQKYVDDINRDYQYVEMLEAAEQNDYRKYLDELDAYKDYRDFEYQKYSHDTQSYNSAIQAAAQQAYTTMRDSESDKKWQAELDYQKQLDADSLAYDFAKLNSDTQKWNSQAVTDRYNALARLVQSVYNKSNIGVNLNDIMELLGM